LKGQLDDSELFLTLQACGLSCLVALESRPCGLKGQLDDSALFLTLQQNDIHVKAKHII
jgi:hypothetical protein